MDWDNVAQIKLVKLLQEKKTTPVDEGSRKVKSVKSGLHPNWNLCLQFDDKNLRIFLLLTYLYCQILHFFYIWDNNHNVLQTV